MIKYQKVRLKESFHSRIARLTAIEKLLQGRYEDEAIKNGYDTRQARQLELAWNLMTARLVKLYHRMYNEKV